MNLIHETAAELQVQPVLLQEGTVETAALMPNALQRLGNLANSTGNHLAEVVKPSIRKLALIGAIASFGGLAERSIVDMASAHGANNGAVEVIHNPVQYEGHAMSCPDPAVFNWGNKYLASCTSDYGQDNPLPGGGMGNYPAAFPIYESSNLKNWTFKNYIFPPGHHPAQAIPPEGNYPGGTYWADEIHHFGNKYEAYFAAQMNQGTIDWINKHYHEHLGPKTDGIFVAWTKNVLSGNWQSRLLHFPGQFNSVRRNAQDYSSADAQKPQALVAGILANSQEIHGGVIDPTVALYPRTGQLIMAYAKQANQIFVGELSPDGLYMKPHVKIAFSSKYKWECSPRNGMSNCVNEGPVLTWNKQNQVMDMFYNAASTWDGSYKIGMAASTDPLHKWTKYPHPIMQSGNGLLGPGIGAQPFTGPNGNVFTAFHVQPQPSHNSQARYLAFGRLHYDTGKQFLIPNSNTSASDNKLPAGHSAQSIRQRRPTVAVDVPSVGNGVPRRAIMLGK